MCKKTETITGFGANRNKCGSTIIRHDLSIHIYTHTHKNILLVYSYKEPLFRVYYDILNISLVKMNKLIGKFNYLLKQRDYA